MTLNSIVAHVGSLPQPAAVEGNITKKSIYGNSRSVNLNRQECREDKASRNTLPLQFE